jgi:hypothetical protein
MESLDELVPLKFAFSLSLSLSLSLFLSFSLLYYSAKVVIYRLRTEPFPKKMAMLAP